MRTMRRSGRCRRCFSASLSQTKWSSMPMSVEARLVLVSWRPMKRKESRKKNRRRNSAAHGRGANAGGERLLLGEPLPKNKRRIANWKQLKFLSIIGRAMLANFMIYSIPRYWVLRHPRVSLLHSHPFVEANFLCAQTAIAAARQVCAHGMCRQTCRHAFALAIVPVWSSHLRLQRGPAWRRCPRSGPPLSAGYQGGGAPS
eukprot:scaffold3785_cov115-Isochrysis_galbana.AAC.5